MPALKHQLYVCPASSLEGRRSSSVGQILRLTKGPVKVPPAEPPPVKPPPDEEHPVEEPPPVEAPVKEPPAEEPPPVEPPTKEPPPAKATAKGRLLTPCGA